MLMWLDVAICVGMSVFRSEAGAKHQRSTLQPSCNPRPTFRQSPQITCTLHDIASICGLRSRQTATPNLKSSFQPEV